MLRLLERKLEYGQKMTVRIEVRRGRGRGWAGPRTCWGGWAVKGGGARVWMWVSQGAYVLDGYWSMHLLLSTPQRTP